ncbi:unnamed protein product, partial [Amoebophrya sp. A120]
VDDRSGASRAYKQLEALAAPKALACLANGVLKKVKAALSNSGCIRGKGSSWDTFSKMLKTGQQDWLRDWDESAKVRLGVNSLHLYLQSQKLYPRSQRLTSEEISQGFTETQAPLSIVEAFADPKKLRIQYKLKPIANEQYLETINAMGRTRIDSTSLVVELAGIDKFFAALVDRPMITGVPKVPRIAMQQNDSMETLTAARQLLSNHMDSQSEAVATKAGSKRNRPAAAGGTTHDAGDLLDFFLEAYKIAREEMKVSDVCGDGPSNWLRASLFYGRILLQKGVESEKQPPDLHRAFGFLIMWMHHQQNRSRERNREDSGDRDLPPEALKEVEAYRNPGEVAFFTPEAFQQFLTEKDCISDLNGVDGAPSKGEVELKLFGVAKQASLNGSAGVPLAAVEAIQKYLKPSAEDVLERIKDEFERLRHARCLREFLGKLQSAIASWKDIIIEKAVQSGGASSSADSSQLDPGTKGKEAARAAAEKPSTCTKGPALASAERFKEHGYFDYDDFFDKQSSLGAAADASAGAAGTATDASPSVFPLLQSSLAMRRKYRDTISDEGCLELMILLCEEDMTCGSALEPSAKRLKLSPAAALELPRLPVQQRFKKIAESLGHDLEKSLEMAKISSKRAKTSLLGSATGGKQIAEGKLGRQREKFRAAATKLRNFEKKEMDASWSAVIRAHGVSVATEGTLAGGGGAGPAEQTSKSPQNLPRGALYEAGSQEDTPQAEYISGLIS